MSSPMYRIGYALSPKDGQRFIKIFNQSSQTMRHRSHQNRPHQTLSLTGTVRLHHPQNLRLRLEQPSATTLFPSPKRRHNRSAGSNQPSPQPCLHA
ncbi:hypothetical protein CFP56_038958 [Quercus suber]|uniref:Uncharacterized protein n=1 Tax=Quercus suber TaxID=58331 RepID=A0AAW0J166_QUESU